MEIQKIEKPEAGWTEKYLKNFGFSFDSEKFKKQKELFMLILNRDLLYFYQVESEECKNLIFIDESTIQNLKKSSSKNYFDKNILKYLLFSDYYIFNTEQDISEKIKTIDQQVKKKRDKKEKYKKQQEEYRQKYYKQQEYKQKQRENKQQNYNYDNNNIQENISYETEKGGIYGIYSVDANQEYQLLYIGLTTRPFHERLQEHKNIIDGIEEIPKGMERLYNLLISESEKKHLEAKYLVSFSKMSANKYLSRSEKEAMEMALIYYFHPPGNTAGITVPYKFSGV